MINKREFDLFRIFLPIEGIANDATVMHNETREKNERKQI